MNRLTRRGFGKCVLPGCAGVLGSISVAGCGYSIRPPFQVDVQTVYVPIFKSSTFRRDLNLMLTEAVQNEIRHRTPFKVVGKPEGADTLLEGEIIYNDKNAFVQNPNNLARQLMASITARVAWIDIRQGGIPRQRDRVTVTEEMFFYPELGETTTAAYSKVIERLARQIVSMMEESW